MGRDDGVQRQDRARHPRFRAGLGTLPSSHGAAGSPQRPLSGVGRHRHRDVGLLRRTRRDARDEPHRRTRRAPLPVSHHRTVLADQGLAAHRPQRHHRRNGDRRGVHRRVSQLQRADSRGHRAAVGGARRTGLQHLLRRQVAPDPTRGVESRCHQTALAVEPWLRTLLRVHGRRDRPVVPGTGVRQPSRRSAGHSRRGLPPLEGPGRQDHRVHSRLQGDRARQAVVQLPVPRRRACAPPRLQGVGRQVRRSLRHGLRGATARSCWRTRSGSASCRRTPSCRPINPYLDVKGPERRGLARPGHRAAVGHPQRRREAAVQPDGRGVRRVPVLHRRPDRPGARLSRGVGPARQHHHRGHLRQRRQR